jgi:FkbM family methyltransferase
MKITPRSVLKSLIRNTLNKVGFDLVPYPLQSWYLLRAELIPLFSALDINCVIDVGAHNGSYGAFLRDIGYKQFIVSFEPMRTNFELLKARSQGDAKWRAFPYALGEESTHRELNVTHETTFSSFLTPNARHFAGMSKIERTEQVEVRRLDTILDESLAGVEDARLFLKMDTQGWDLHVLEGAKGILDRVLALQSEVSVQPIYSGMTSYLECIGQIARKGFVPVACVPVSRGPRRDLIEFDYLMVRATASPNTFGEGGRTDSR